MDRRLGLAGLHKPAANQPSQSKQAGTEQDQSARLGSNAGILGVVCDRDCPAISVGNGRGFIVSTANKVESKLTEAQAQLFEARMERATAKAELEKLLGESGSIPPPPGTWTCRPSSRASSRP